MTKPQRDLRNPGIPFDPLQYVKRLEAVGFTRAQAEEQAETFLAIVQEQLVSKQDFKELESKTSVQFKELESKMSTQFKELESKTSVQFKELESKMSTQFKEVDLKFELVKRDLKIWFGGMLVGLVVIMSSIMGLLVHLNGH